MELNHGPRAGGDQHVPRRVDRDPVPHHLLSEHRIGKVLERDHDAIDGGDQAEIGGTTSHLLGLYHVSSPRCPRARKKTPTAAGLDEPRTAFWPEIRRSRYAVATRHYSRSYRFSSRSG